MGGLGIRSDRTVIGDRVITMRCLKTSRMPRNSLTFQNFLCKPSMCLLHAAIILILMDLGGFKIVFAEYSGSCH